MMATDTSTDAVTALTDAWYNQLAASLSLSVRNFQLLQPPAVPTGDQSLWDSFNVVPPVTLKYNRWVYQQPAFFKQYAALVNSLSFPESAFVEDIGADTYVQWTAYLKTVSPPPAPNELPGVWFQWAMLHAPSVANIGRSDLATQLLIGGAQAALEPYEGPDAKQADYSPSFGDLKNILKLSSGASFSFDSSTADPDVSGSWVPGDDPNYFGVWTGSSTAFRISRKFALSKITVTAAFDHFGVVPVTPGPWYNSSMLHLAWVSGASVPPWVSESDWDRYFGASGKLTHAIGSVLAADGITLTLHSDANFSPEEQAVIRVLALMGDWPVYCPVQLSAITNTVTSAPGSLTIRFHAAPGNPVILGYNVFDIRSYTGA
ncbi:hypothetical protein GCM10010967_32140 [Dyadobacter beijingensis]|uniref:Uncharacterized protein n=1 Tax=Dyadobacter beijingensis TaxID=365489 RepID=A0ABQ2I1K9_9BACT|nr:hypothetical protein [Dyadobacter beijingensis]GGM96167.1 hypothetical protein GCM10010967_32140 [Dyadobacter beijingensis]